MNLHLTTWQRVKCINIISELQGDARLLRKAFRLLDLLDLSSAEKEEIGLYQDASGIGWDPAKAQGKVWDIEIPDPELVDFLKLHVQHHGRWPVSSAREIFDLLEQLGIQEGEHETSVGAPVE